MTAYTHNALIVCPELQIDNLNHLSGCLGLSMADAAYFGEPNYTYNGNSYCVRHTACTDRLLSSINEPVTRPEHDTNEELDLTKASLAQAQIVIWEWNEDSLVYPGTSILYAVDVDPHTAIAQMGLTKIEEPQ